MINTDVILRAGVGYLLGTFVAQGIEGAIEFAGAGEVDLPDSAFGVLGAALGADKRILDLAAKQMRRRFKRSWSSLSKEEWEEFKQTDPATAEYLQEALRV